MENKDCYTCKYNPELCHYTWDECTGNNNAKWRPMGEVKNLTIPCVVGRSEQLPCKHPANKVEVWGNGIKCTECGKSF